MPDGAQSSWGQSAVGREIMARDWTGSPLGAIDAWPRSIVGILSTMLACPTPMFLAWGPRLQSFYNDAYVPVLLDRADGALGRPFDELWSDLWDVVGPMCRSAMAGNPVRVIDQRLVMDRHGVPTETWWSFSYSAVHDDAGAVVGMFCVTGETTARVLAEVSRTLTDREAEEARVALRGRLEEQEAALVAATRERSAAESQVRQLQKMESIGQLTGGIAHDFNNMLAVVIGGLDLLKRRLAKGDTDVDRYVDGAMEGATRAATLTQRLLAFARQAPLAPEVLDPNRLVSGLTDLLARTLGDDVRIETVLSAGLWRVHADAGQLENAIVNLAVNGRDAMPDGGRLTIETANAHIDRDYADEFSVEPGQYVLIAVTDTGAGMDAATIDKAFDPFFTTKGVGKGTGLGLSQVFGFVRQSRGHLRIYSEVGHGTTVKVYLPRRYGDEPVAKPRPVPGTDALGGPRELVLVVEDDARVRQFSVEALRELGYTTVHAASAEEALTLIEAGQGATLLFTDVVMPGMTGRQLADRACALLPGLKVLYTTGYTRNAIVHNGTLDPGTNFLAKPFDLAALARAVREAIDGD